MRHFIKLKDGEVISETFSKQVPGDSRRLPADMLEVTDRTDGPWLGKLYNDKTNTFSTKPFIDRLATLRAKDSTDWKLADIAEWLKLKG